ncbi:MAG: hypothetical protein VZS44_09910 [Bacilli bacterium]|nr:hypothetical protein [Bacilli bacterium]
MSRDWTPYETRMVQKQYNIPNPVDCGWVIHIGEENEKPLFSEEDIELAHTYAQLGLWGFDFLRSCKRNGVLADEYGQQIIQSIEDYFNGAELENKELREKVDLWYNGELEPGYDLSDNNWALADYIRSLIKGEVEDE